MNNRRDGFTIVELLIVIVVIAILATITVVSYNGITASARVSSALSSVSSYEKALKLYLAEYGNYPEFWGAVCLGEGYADRDDDGTGDCGASDYPATENASFNTELRKVISSLPPISTHPVRSPFASDVTWVGAYIMRWDDVIYEGATAPYVLSYVLEGGNTSCRNEATMETVPDQSWPITRKSTTGYSWSDGITTECRISLPTPEHYE